MHVFTSACNMASARIRHTTDVQVSRVSFSVQHDVCTHQTQNICAGIDVCSSACIMASARIRHTTAVQVSCVSFGVQHDVCTHQTHKRCSGFMCFLPRASWHLHASDTQEMFRFHVFPSACNMTCARIRHTTDEQACTYLLPRAT